MCLLSPWSCFSNVSELLGTLSVFCFREALWCFWVLGNCVCRPDANFYVASIDAGTKTLSLLGQVYRRARGLRGSSSLGHNSPHYHSWHRPSGCCKVCFLLCSSPTSKGWDQLASCQCLWWSDSQPLHSRTRTACRTSDLSVWRQLAQFREVSPTEGLLSSLKCLRGLWYSALGLSGSLKAWPFGWPDVASHFHLVYLGREMHRSLSGSILVFIGTWVIAFCAFQSVFGIE